MYRSAGALGPHKKALEIGCGTGIFTSLIARSGADITAVELSPELVERARAQNPAPNVKYRVMNVEELDFPENSFDCVYGSSVLHHLNLPKALPEMLRVLRPGGNFVFTEPNMLNPQIMLQKNIPALKAFMGDSPDETAFFRWQIKGTLLDAGFSGVKTEPFDFLHPWVPGALAPAADKLGALLGLPLLHVKRELPADKGDQMNKSPLYLQEACWRRSLISGEMKIRLNWALFLLTAVSYTFYPVGICHYSPRNGRSQPLSCWAGPLQPLEKFHWKRRSLN